jgi:hypothetical protein
MYTYHLSIQNPERHAHGIFETIVTVKTDESAVMNGRVSDWVSIWMDGKEEME